MADKTQSTSAIGSDTGLTTDFIQTGTLPKDDDSRQPRAANDDEPVLAFAFDLGSVRNEPVTRQVMLGYDEIYEVKFFRRDLRPWWRRNGATPADLFQAARRDYAGLVSRCETFDRELTGDARKLGGDAYATICALAYRQALGAHGIAADANGQPLLFPKENTSNGDISTVDVFFPGDPLFLLLRSHAGQGVAGCRSWRTRRPTTGIFPTPRMTWARTRWRSDATRAVRRCPWRESGNMLLLCDAVSQIDGNTGFVDTWWPQLTQWAKFLEQYGLDPENQLCTDDFMGHLAHNANLSIKAILALAAYGDMCKLHGDEAGAARYAGLAREDAAHWIKAADAGGSFTAGVR